MSIFGNPVGAAVPIDKMLPLDGSKPMAGDIDMDGHKLTGLNAPITNDQAANKGYVDSFANSRCVRNLLDNSDFSNPVNQRGYIGGTNGANNYCIDRWILQYGTNITMMDGFIRLGGQYNFWQIIPTALKSGKTYTCSAKVKAYNGNRKLYFYVRNNDGDELCSANGIEIDNTWVVCSMKFTAQTDIVNAMVEFHQSNENVDVSTDIEWVALYEGEYTAETLPPYVPKGYGAELAECLRYFKQYDDIYPVGSIYMSADATSPASLFGGTWEQIKDKFLLSAGDTYWAGATGGEADVTLTTDQIPSHTHTHYSLYYDANTDETYHFQQVTSGGLKYNSGDTNTSAAGGGSAHNNMPPYLAVYMWKRIA